ncbi:AAA domain-containing protein [Riemerella anatipestifer]|uniref:AAA domain-containing protein n=2 Tax=Riemerella anatipestifer TaxID=34085 RepID=UPI001BDB63B2|nr:AAA domain-containing protein [Riemerella anatipestifer]MBT0552412.1 AAA family ATPase [Riemerella anatipestifer]MBT0554715.1 AAA family ATPase [Riemerella anatipestifer]MCE3025189.1 AAA domain-containing protein [Riemerella anatipestifer]MCU7542092.1 AAA domain-containing protein [Riemerella anatipestifer]MCU7560805.1 AAA domain-containing protein [Riemerella anatipestifer]
METLGQYNIIQELQELNDNLSFWLTENNDGQTFEVLTIAKNPNFDRLIDRLILNEIRPLINKEIAGFQKIIETGFDIENQVYFIVYENFGGQPLNEVYENANILSLKEIAKGLDDLKKDNRQTYIISPKYISVNTNGTAKVRFIGLFEFFKFENLLETEFLSPNVVEWLNDTKKPRPNFQDDIYSLVKTFEQYIQDTYNSENNVISEILKKSLCVKRTERFSKYHKFVELLEQIPFTQKQTFKTNSQIVRAKTQPQYEQDIQELINSMNENVWFLVENKLSDRKEQITGQFSTNTWNGRFFIDEQGYIFIPFNGCRSVKNDRMIKNGNSFLSQFSFSQSTANFNCLSFFKGKFNEQNRLAEFNKMKKQSVKLWQTLPDKEREYIEETAFKAKFKSRETTTNGSNIKFQLIEVSDKSWVRLKELKNEGVILFIDDQKIGKILDFHPKENFITIKDAFCNIDEISESGELIEDVRQETSPFKKQVEACKKFEKTDVVNPALCSILATPETTAMPNNSYLQTWEFENFRDEVFNSNLKNDDTQREAVLEALHHKPVYLIQGPPGAGKITVIVELIRQLIKRQKDVKILVTSQSNLAVDNVLEKLDEINQKEEADLLFMRLASENTLEKENIRTTILPHMFENKLKNWVTETEQRAKNYFSEHFSTQQKHKNLIEFYDFYSLLDKENDWNKFNNRLRMSQNYLKQLFENAKDFKEVKKIFEKELGSEFLKLKNIQRDWFAFLGGVTVEDGKDRKKSMLNNGSTEIDFLTAMMLQTNIMGATCIHIASSKYSKVNFRFDYVIMDESSKASPAETLVPINMGQNIILIGDHNQLPPVVTREEAVKKNVKTELEDNGLDFEKAFGESLFEKLIKAFEADESKQNYIKMLDIQYRMPKQVGSLISKYFYDSKLKNPETSIIPDYDKQKHHELTLKKDTSIIFFSTSQRENPNDNDNKFNRQNKCNVQAIKELLEKLNTLYSDNLAKSKPFTIGIIAGYRGQVDLLKSSINLSQYSNFVQVETDESGRQKKTNLIEINTVDKFQGAERDIIIYDIVRSSKGQSNIGFLDDYRRINVAFSRVKRLLIVVGNSEYLIKRATLNQGGRFTEFKLQQIGQELQEQGLVFNQLHEIF